MAVARMTEGGTHVEEVYILFVKIKAVLLWCIFVTLSSFMTCQFIILPL